MIQPIVEKEFKMEIDELRSILKFKWEDCTLTSDRFKEIVSMVANKALEYHPKYLFVDARLNNFTMSIEVQEWHDKTIVPIYVKAGIRAIAFLIPTNIFSMVTHKQTFKKDNAKQAIKTQFFDSEQYVMDWFKYVA